MNNDLIRIESMYKIYNQGSVFVNALNGVSIDIKSGEFVAIVGSSGSGKSTLMNMIGCLDSATKGKYMLEGTDISLLPDRHLSLIRNEKIGFIFQGFNLISGLSAVENVELPLIYRKIPRSKRREIAMNALSQVFLKNRAEHRPSQLSGGQQQRVAIARAIAGDPAIILADEPTGNLDTKSGQEVMKILTKLNSEGKTIILITHDLQIAKQAKRILTISDGNVESDVLGA